MAQLAASKESIGTGRYHARHFAAPPSAAVALALLDEIAASTPDFPTIPADLPLALYGAGNLGQMAREFLAEVGRDFDFVIDRNADALSEHPMWRDKPIYAPDAVPAHLKQSHLVLITVVTAPYMPLEAMLDDLGFAHIVPFYDFAENFRTVHSLSNGWYAPPLSEADRQNAAKVLPGFADDASRAHHLQFLAWRQLRQEWLFDGTVVANHNRFFIPEVLNVLETDPIFLDGGPTMAAFRWRSMASARNGAKSLRSIRMQPIAPCWKTHSATTGLTRVAPGSLATYSAPNRARHASIRAWAMPRRYHQSGRTPSRSPRSTLSMWSPLSSSCILKAANSTH